MSETSTMVQQAEEIRQETISIVENLMERAEAFELPKPPEELERYSRELEENTYKVLVVGEAKRGKSSFINALIGRDILPTNVRIATSQVFNVRPAEREAYRLRFEDGSAREIAPGDLPRYGSQVVEDTGEKPRLDQVVRWIEVDEPDIRFLPKGVGLLDTPGLGALYAAHAQITQRFVPQADAVIFVLDSEKPIVRSELEFIETILSVTSDIFFVQTKIDLYDEEHWQSIQRRNREILDEEFGGWLKETEVWPFSSALLLAAAAGGVDAEEDLEDSRLGEMKTALKAFLFRVAGWSRSAEAIVVADHYQATSRRTLSARSAGLDEESDLTLRELERLAVQRRELFEAEWGSLGHKRSELMERVRRTAERGRESLVQALGPDGPIETPWRDRIEAVESFEEARKLNEAMPGEVAAAAQEEWRQTCMLVQKRCGELLGTFLDAADNMVTLQGPEQPALAMRGRPLQEVKNTVWENLKDALPGDDAVTITGNALDFVLFALASPVTLVAATGGLIWTVVSNRRARESALAEDAKRHLHDNLKLTLEDVRHGLLEADLRSEQDSPVDEYLHTLRRAISERIQTVASQRFTEVQAEIDRLAEQADLDDRQRETRAEQTRRQLSEWDDIGGAIEGVGARLNSLNRPPAPASLAAE